MSCTNYSRTKCFKNCKNISTDGEVMSKIKVACFFSGPRCIYLPRAYYEYNNYYVILRTVWRCNTMHCKNDPLLSCINRWCLIINRIIIIVKTILILNTQW